MVRQQFELAIPMGGLFGVSLYSVVGVPTLDGYRQEPLDGYAFSWQWFANLHTADCVRAFLLYKPVRILATSIGDGPAAYDIPAGMMVVHDLGRVWAMTLENFDEDYYAVQALVSRIPKNSNP